MRHIYMVFTVILAVILWFKGEDIRSDIYTAAAFIMFYIESRSK